MRNINETLRIVLKIKAKNCLTSVLHKTACALKFKVFQDFLWSLGSVGEVEIF